MNKNLEIDLLRTFLRITETRNFTHAAAQLYRTQSAVSLQIKRLEELIGSKVFERSSKSVTLTPAGRALLPFARRMLQINDEACDYLQELPKATTLRIGTTQQFAANQLTPLLEEFIKEYPEALVTVRVETPARLLDALKANRLDAALFKSLRHYSTSVPVWEEETAWVAAQSFDVQSKKILPLILFSSDCVYRELLLDSLSQQPLAAQPVFESSDFVTVRGAISRGLGVGILGASSLHTGLRALTADEGFPKLPRSAVYLYQSPSRPSAIARRFIRFAKRFNM